MRFLKTLWILILMALLAACVRSASDTPAYQPGSGFPTSSVFVPIPGSSATPSFRLQPTRLPGSALLTPTPNLANVIPTARSEAEQYVVQYGDTLGTIAMAYGVSVEAVIAANNLANPNLLEVGQVLVIPVPSPQAAASYFKIIPDSELVYGPMSATLELEAYIQDRGGYLASYSQDVDGELLSGSEIVLRVAQYYSVNPRLLLAILEYQSGWVGNANPDPSTYEYPIGLLDAWHAGLYRQLAWTADTLNRGYYLWRVGGIRQWVLADGSVVPVDPFVNAGTAGVQNFFAQLDDYASWQYDTSMNGLFSMVFMMWGYPFDLAIEPIVPANLVQPTMQLPFASGETWAFTGGPHGGWDTGSGWAALDFAPTGTAGCVVSDAWVTAVADGLVVRTGDGVVIQDLDSDGFEQTGWVIFYLHIESRDRVELGTYLRAGERIGHPSCEGGVTNGTHVHMARKFNGEWIPADGPVPFVLDGWVSSGAGIEYDGYLTRGSQSVEAFDGDSEINQVSR
jgi:murein DD-endopeptidase MepM/ murein hydrolase activator NlpD